jgi:hypothetical protein
MKAATMMVMEMMTTPLYSSMSVEKYDSCVRWSSNQNSKSQKSNHPTWPFPNAFFLFHDLCGSDGYVNNDGSIDGDTSTSDKNDGDMVEEGITFGMVVVDIQENVVT